MRWRYLRKNPVIIFGSDSNKERSYFIGFSCATGWMITGSLKVPQAAAELYKDPD
jgi:hypothetical protein